MLVSAIYYVSLFTAVQYFLFGFYLVTVKRNRILSNRILALFLITAAIRLVDVTFFSGLIAWMLVFLIGPLILFYTKSVADNRFTFIWKDIFHFLPFLMYFLFVLFNYSDFVTRKYFGSLFFYISVVPFDIHVGIYAASSILLIKKYKNELKNNLSEIGEADLKWLKIFIFIFLISWYAGIILNWYGILVLSKTAVICF